MLQIAQSHVNIPNIVVSGQSYIITLLCNHGMSSEHDALASMFSGSTAPQGCMFTEDIRLCINTQHLMHLSTDTNISLLSEQARHAFLQL